MNARFSSGKSIPTIRSINACAVLARYVTEQGIDLQRLLSGTGIHVSDLDDAEFFTSPEQEISVIRNLVRLIPTPGLGLIIGHRSHIGVFGIIGAAALNSNTFLDAIKIFREFAIPSMSCFQFDVRINDGFVFTTMKELIDFKEIRLFACERLFTSLVRIASDLLGAPIKLKELHAAYPKPDHAPNYRDFFQCPIEFNSNKNMISFEKSVLNKPLPMADPLSRKTFEKECRELAIRLKKQETISQVVVQEILYCKNHVPSFDRLARSLNMSVRTLRRRLREEGTTYRELLSEVQKKKAIELLQTTPYSVEQVAIEVGFNDLPNFYRAFKRWTGKTPGDYREKTNP